MLFYYYHQGRVLSFESELPEGQYPLGTDETEHGTKFVSITEARANELAAQKEENANGIVLAPEEQRRHMYETLADQYLLAYNGYMLEGMTDKAEEQKQLYLSVKAEIRRTVPDTP